MAIATGTGAEVQKPLAAVVTCGVMKATLLTLVILPALYKRCSGAARLSVILSVPGIGALQDAFLQPTYFAHC